MANFFISKNSAGEFYFYLRADNNEIILTSESYKAKASAINGIEAIKKTAPGAGVLDISDK